MWMIKKGKSTPGYLSSVLSKISKPKLKFIRVDENKRIITHWSFIKKETEKLLYLRRETEMSYKTFNQTLILLSKWFHSNSFITFNGLPIDDYWKSVPD